MKIHSFLARLSALLLMTPLCAWAASPASGTLTDMSGPLTYTSGPFNTANPTPIPQVDVGPECANPGQVCDMYNLSVTLPPGYHAAHPNAAVKVTLSWTDTGSGNSDYDLYVYQGTNTTPDGSQQSYTQSASGANPEIASFGNLANGTAKFTVIVVPYTPTGEITTTTIELLPGASGCTVNCGSTFGGADPTSPGVARYQNFYAPNGTSAQPGNGEFNIGFNPATGRIMTMSRGPIWRLTPPEVVNPSKPEICDALWEDKSSANTNTGLDPILWTDQANGRTFASNSTTGANGAYAYSDNDGDLWVPVGAGPPDGGADHQTIGTGPFPASLQPLTTPVNHGEFVLYCSQDIVGPAFCQTSLDFGASYGAGHPAYDGTTTTCGGLHGHAHIAKDGTAYLPVNQCAGKQGGAVSIDAGTTWNEFIVTGSHSQVRGADPSVALDADSTAYYCYVNNEPVPTGNAPEGHVHVQVSRDGGKTWMNDTDLGLTHGIVNAAHTEAVGGSSGRASCGFIGTNVSGDYQALSFPGVWYAFIATTYDGGATWTTINATPNDPVQSKTGVWQGGGGNTNRNLLDFNEITLDAKGHPLYGYSDGCVTAECISGSGANDFTAWMRVARESGGKSLLAAFDTVEPVAPNRACMAGARDASAAHLSWKVPDNGGADIANYLVLRGTTAGGETQIGQTGGPINHYDDTTANPAVADYYYAVKAVNASGTGLVSDEVKLSVVAPGPTETVCTVPGKTLATDPAGDNVIGPGPAPAGTDLLSLQIAQPLAADSSSINLTFTLNTDAGMSPQPAGSAWYVAMKIADPSPATTFHYRGVMMTWSGPTPTFQSYTPSAGQSGNVDGRFVTAGSTLPATGSYDTPYNKIVITVPATQLGLAPGDVISGFISGSTQSTDPGGIGAGATQIYDGMPDSLTFMNPYTVGNSFDCNDTIFKNGFE